MMMTKAVDAYSALSPHAQSRFLAELARRVAAWAKGAYPSATGDAAASSERLAAYNELQELVAIQLVALLDGTVRHRDDWLVGMLFDLSGPAGCADRLGALFDDLQRAYLRSLPCESS